MTTSIETSDIKQVGLSQQSAATLELLIEKNLIAQKLDGMRLAAAIAIDQGVNPFQNQESVDRTTSQAVSGLDEEGGMRLAVSEIYPHCSKIPARAIQDLIEQGLILIAHQYDIEKEEFSFLHFFGPRTKHEK